MFIGETKHAGYPARTTDGLRWKLHKNSPQYRAWNYWLSLEFGKSFSPEPVVVVWAEWPPSTRDGADQVAQIVSDIRNGEYQGKPIGGALVPRHPEPWTGFVPADPGEDVDAQEAA